MLQNYLNLAKLNWLQRDAEVSCDTEWLGHKVTDEISIQ